ncbi:hypothetical protein P8452_26966 [Trifolium repens]|nr:hypothetical protein P8452_26966 [Trifolium repens]
MMTVPRQWKNILVWFTNGGFLSTSGTLSLLSPAELRFRFFIDNGFSSQEVSSSQESLSLITGLCPVSGFCSISSDIYTLLRYVEYLDMLRCWFTSSFNRPVRFVKHTQCIHDIHIHSYIAYIFTSIHA